MTTDAGEGVCMLICSNKLLAQELPALNNDYHILSLYGNDDQTIMLYNDNEQSFL